MTVRTKNKLTAQFVKTVKKPGRQSDGGGLYLNVSKTGAKSWVFMWKRNGRRREMGLGSATGQGNVAVVSLSLARDKADGVRSTLAEEGDPFIERHKSNAMPFGEVADGFLDAMEGSWSNDKHRKQWRQTLLHYCLSIRDVPVDEINTEHVLSVLSPIWDDKHETASRLRGRIERVLDYAKSKDYRSGENPARWRGHLKNILPPRQKLTRGHHAAMDYKELPAFMQRLKHSKALSARSLEVLILTAGRTSEVLKAQWGEIDLDEGLWVVPAERMKGKRVHRVPLSEQVLQIITPLYKTRTGEFLFPGSNSRRPLSNMAMNNLIKRMKLSDVTVHGFRSGFRDWVGEETDIPRDLAEIALAHVVGDETERAYRRGDALERRRELMQAWADYCLP
jgi:integrase